MLDVIRGPFMFQSQSMTIIAASRVAISLVTPRFMMPEPENPRLITSRFGVSRRAIWFVKICPGREAQQPCAMLVPYQTILLDAESSVRTLESLIFGENHPKKPVRFDIKPNILRY